MAPATPTRDVTERGDTPELLDAASGKTKREVEHLLAVRFPRPDVPSSLRKRPERRGARTTKRLRRNAAIAN
jgi:hypothetical protein